MEVPEPYLEALPKVLECCKIWFLCNWKIFVIDFHCRCYLACSWFQNVRASLGDLIYRYITSDQFSPECVLSHLDFTSEQALEVANRVEASIIVWHQRHYPKPVSIKSQPTSRQSWKAEKELMADADKTESIAERAESLLFCIKQRFPGLPQTTLEMSKVQFNKVWFNLIQNFSYHCILFSMYILNRPSFPCSSGYWEIHFRKLLKSFGELGSWHFGSYRWFIIYGWLDESVFANH